MKFCPKCKVEKDLSEFYKNKNTKSGLASWCKDCDKKKVAAYQLAHPDRVLKASREWKDRNREVVNEYARDYYWENRGEVIPKQRVYYPSYQMSHAEELREYQRNYKKLNPDKINAQCSKRRAIKMGARVEGILDRELIFDRDHGVCYLCGNFVNPNNWVEEHVVPLFRGGSHSYDNVKVAHPLCNSRKGRKLLAEYLPEIVEVVEVPV